MNSNLSSKKNDPKYYSRYSKTISCTKIYIRFMECLISWLLVLKLAENSNKVIGIKETIIECIEEISKSHYLLYNQKEGIKGFVKKIRNLDVDTSALKRGVLEIYKLNLRQRSDILDIYYPRDRLQNQKEDIILQKQKEDIILRKQKENIKTAEDLMNVLYNKLLDKFNSKEQEGVIIMSRKLMGLEYEIGINVPVKKNDTSSKKSKILFNKRKSKIKFNTLDTPNILNIVLSSIKKEKRWVFSRYKDIKNKQEITAPKVVLSFFYTMNYVNYDIIQNGNTENSNTKEQLLLKEPTIKIRIKEPIDSNNMDIDKYINSNNMDIDNYISSNNMDIDKYINSNNTNIFENKKGGIRQFL